MRGFFDCIFIVALQDITVQKMQQEEIAFLAYHDPLTRLPNRRYFHNRLDEALEHANKNETLALLLIDMDRFKLLNDTCGHLAGDETLRQVAQILRDCQGEHGLAARMGGDEFVMFIANSPSVREVERLAEQIRHRFADYISKFRLTAVGLSIGCSFYPDDGTEGQALIHSADNAMYEVKHAREQEDSPD
jgi:diguanylate cyclase (GGDEF)-like protein